MEKTHLSSLLLKKLITQHLIYFRCIFLLLLVPISTCAQSPIIHISTGTVTVGLGIEVASKQDSIPVFVSNGATIINAQELKNVEFKHEKNKIKYAKTPAKAVNQNVTQKVSKKLTPKKEEFQFVKESKSNEVFVRSQQKVSLILTSNQEIQNAYLVLESKFLLSFFCLKSKILSREQCIVIDKIFINLKDRGPPSLCLNQKIKQISILT
ncbi:hypothetical protein NAL32_16310 [Chryseobacterium sp. Ch-15]|uniref:DUF4140 domain-containing protein n=1 Tax=Chryseobacterium muglaense TaxID=2893752 RepID=A0A9Q3UX77_9FLAO|nr:hypothetical protein [Chryseobacterium muglaense]MBD3906259.1 hypothetical protein [Chryseobacterium muglaense]MCC9036769.1 hypothetical protein [Chryseobacterium muglaense]MCM2555950.1 hypothetical protein [Chryseobacterium muglaense]